MIDTIRLRSPSLSENEACAIESQTIAKMGVDLGTGEIKYRFTSGELSGSYDYRIRFSLERSEWIYNEEYGYPEKRPCAPYVILECSVHKLIVGHNLFGGPLNVSYTVCFLIDLVSSLLGVELPPFYEWIIERIDFAKCFNLGSPFAVRSYIQSISRCEYPRRVGRRFVYGDSTVMFSGTTTNVKFYDKGKEFRKHDYKRLAMGYVSLDELQNLKSFADNLLRVEVQVNEKKLINDFGDICTCIDVTDEYLSKLFNSEVEKVIKVDGLNVVRNSIDVQMRLQALYPKMANTLYGTWSKICVHGEKFVRENMSKATFYRHRKMLLEAGISWVGSDVQLIESCFPSDFSPVCDSRYCVVGEHPKVVEAYNCVSEKVENILRRAS